MRILHTVQYYEPQKGGSEEVVRQLSERLAAKGHDVTVATARDPRRTATTLNGVTIREFDVSGNAVRGYRGDPESYRRFLLTERFDVMLNYAAQCWPTDLALPLLDRIAGRRILVPCGYSGLRDPAYAGYFAALPAALAPYDALVYMSERTPDTIFDRAHGLAAKGRIIPNGAGEEFTTPAPGFRARHGIRTKYFLVTVGNHTGAKGHDVVLDAVRRLRRDDVTLGIIGDPLGGWRYPWRGCTPSCAWAALRDRRIRLLTGLPRADVVSALAASDLFLFGSRIECAPLVMYEAFAAGVPFMTVPVGNVEDHAPVIRLVRDAGEMAAAAGALLDDPARRRGMADAARDLWRRDHTWAALVDRYETLYREASGTI